MEIKKFCLNNVGRFEQVAIPLAPTPSANSNITVFIGNNGAGKTSLLQSLATALSWFVARLRTEKGSGSPLSEEFILNEAHSAAIDLTLSDKISGQAELYQWRIAKTRSGKKGQYSSQLSEASSLAQHYRQMLTDDEQCSLPLLAFYPVERVVLDIPLKLRNRHSFRQLDGYDNSLNQGVDFRRFFEWFREREDSENESGMSQEMLQQLQNMLEDNTALWKELERLNAASRDRQLTAVRSAISEFMPGFGNLKVRRKPRLHMSIDKNGRSLNVSQLSQGEKSLMALVGDIARRLAMMNPKLENPLHGDGVVLIDEIDMHLHPSWQRSILQRLSHTFPNCQFVLTTHSPLVISDYKNVLVYSLEQEGLRLVPSQYGQDANMVLLEVMDTDARNAEVERRLNDLLDAIQNRQFNLAHEQLQALEQELPSNHLELTKARFLLKKQELRRAENQ